MADQSGDITLEQLLIQMAEVVAIELVDFLEGERFLGIGDAEVIAEMAPIAQGAVSDRINELIEEPQKSGWSDSMIRMPLQEAFYALQAVRSTEGRPIRNQPQPAQTGGRKRRRRRRGRRRAPRKAEERQDTLFHPDEDASDPDNYDEEGDPGGPFYESDGLSERDQAWLANQARRDQGRGDYYHEDSF